jgi:4-amino-4-deoxy-L-arabinose transferase-like glycosyltransferase
MLSLFRNRETSLTALVLLAAAVLFFGRLGERGVVSEELRWAQIAREMRHSGDFFRPTINGKNYYDKPLGSYWLIVASSYLTGSVDETAARLPAAVFGLLGVWLTMRLARRLHGPACGILAGAILASSFGFIFYARRATADIETVVGVLAAVALYERSSKPGLWLLGLWTIMAATSLTKGLLGFALPVAVFSVHAGAAAWMETRSWRSAIAGQWWLFNRWSLVAIPLALVVFAAPFAVSIVATGSTVGLELLFRENIRRFVAPHNHTGPIYLYAGVIFVLLAPWSFFLPAALVPDGRPRTRKTLLAPAYFWAMFAFFTLSASRRNYYLLPILPPAAILIAQTLTSAELSPWGRRLRSTGVVLFVVLFSAAGVLLLTPVTVLPSPWNELPPLPARGVFALGWAGCLLAVAGSWSRRRFAATLAVPAFAAFAYAFLVVLPAFDALRPRSAFVAAVHKSVGSEPLALFHARDIVFDLDASAPVPEYADPALLASHLRTGEIRWVIARKRYLRDVVLPAQIVADEGVQPWEHAEQTGDRMVLLQAYAP